MARHVWGVLIAVIAVGLLAVFAVSIAISGSWQNWIKDYQGLIVGGAAFAAALLAYSGLERQAVRETERRRDELRRESFAARAVLPLALTEICEYAQSCVAELLPSIDGESFDRGDFQPPLPPTRVIDQIQNCIRFADGGRASELADLVAQLQIQSARLRGLSIDEVASQYTRIGVCIDCVTVYARASALFEYGRRVPDSEPIQGLVGAGLLCRIIPGEHPMLDEELAGSNAEFQETMLSYR